MFSGLNPDQIQYQIFKQFFQNKYILKGVHIASGLNFQRLLVII